MKGFRRHHLMRHSIGFDDDTYAAICKRVRKHKTTFNEQVRLLVEWGLEAAESE
jgi:hypothetical protein